MSHDERHQAGASARSVSISSLVLRRPVQAKSTEASGKGCYIGATDGKTEVIMEPKMASPPELFAGEDRLCQDSLY